jgi:sugar fermentation stimulation protein A
MALHGLFRRGESDIVQVEFAPLVSGTFVRRDNRFRVQVRIAERISPAHLPNSGRLGELLVPGREVWCSAADPRRAPHRSTAYDLLLVNYAGRLVSVDARLPGHLVAAGLRQGGLTPFQGYAAVQREVSRGDSRLDFRLQDPGDKPDCWIEVKSVTLVENGAARFPDAPTLRGQRHVTELMHAVKSGERAAVIFVIQRDDALRFTPHDQADPDFGRTLRQAATAGVEIYAWRCSVSLKKICLIDTVLVEL